MVTAFYRHGLIALPSLADQNKKLVIANLKYFGRAGV